MLSRKFSLKSNSEFQTVYRKGIKIRGRFGMMIGLKNFVKSSPPLSQGETQIATKVVISSPKFGFVISTKIGNAVKRHKFKRRLSEICREYIIERRLATQPLLFQYVSFEYPESFEELRKEVRWQLDKLVRQLDL